MELLFNQEILERCKDDDPYIMMQNLCEIYLEFNIENSLDGYTSALNGYAYLLAFAKKWQIPHSSFEIIGTRAENIKRVNNFAKNLKFESEKLYTAKTIKTASQEYDLLFGNEFYYEFDDDDFGRIQQLINELRDLIKGLKEISKEHKDRLLKRLETLQTDLNKRVGNFDKFWGTIIEIFGYVGQIGEKAKPIIDRCNEIVDIVTKIMKINTGTFLLEPPEEETKQIDPPEAED